MCSTDSVEFMFLLWLTHLPALGVRQIAQSACIFSPAMNANGGMGCAGQDQGLLFCRRFIRPGFLLHLRSLRLR